MHLLIKKNVFNKSLPVILFHIFCGSPTFLPKLIFTPSPGLLTILLSLVVLHPCYSLHFPFFQLLLLSFPASICSSLRRSTPPASAMRSLRYLPSLWIQTPPSPCPTWCLISASCRTPAPQTVWWCLGMPWLKETTPHSPPLLSMPPHRGWST